MPHLVRSSLLLILSGNQCFDIETITVPVRIDDEFIDNNDDPLAIIAPVWFTATIYHGEEKYNESLSSFPGNSEMFMRFYGTWLK